MEKRNNRIRGLLRADPKNAHALRALRELDAEEKLDPYLYVHILGFQAFDPDVHTPEYAIQQDSIDMIEFIRENGTWTENVENVVLKSLQYQSSKTFIYMMTEFNLTLDDLESIIDRSTDEIDFTEEMALFLLDNWFDIHDYQYIVHRVILAAASNNNIDMLHRLGALVGWTVVLLDAVRTSISLDAVNYLVTRGAKVNRALPIAVNNLDTVKYLVQNGADIEFKDNQALIMAAAKGKLDVVQYLVEDNNADIYARNSAAIALAFENNHWDVVKYLFTFASGIDC